MAMYFHFIDLFVPFVRMLRSPLGDATNDGGSRASPVVTCEGRQYVDIPYPLLFPSHYQSDIVARLGLYYIYSLTKLHYCSFSYTDDILSTKILHLLVLLVLDNKMKASSELLLTFIPVSIFAQPQINLIKSPRCIQPVLNLNPKYCCHLPEIAKPRKTCYP